MAQKKEHLGGMVSQLSGHVGDDVFFGLVIAEMVKRTICSEDLQLQRLLFAYLMRENRVFLCLKIALKASEPDKSAYLQEISTSPSPHLSLVLKA